MKSLTNAERQLAEVAAKLIEKAEEVGLPDPPDKLGITPHAIRFLARAYVELRKQVRSLHDLVDQTDPNDPVGVALTTVGLAQRPADSIDIPAKPRLVRSPTQVPSDDDLLAHYCHVMREVKDVFLKYESYIVRQWDGMDGCWTDCTGEVSREEALQCWAEKTDRGTHHVSYNEIDYYQIFPGGTSMIWDGSEGREMHR